MIAILLSTLVAWTAPAIHVSPSAAHRGDTVRVYGSAGDCHRGNAVTVMSRAFAGRVFAGVGGARTPVRAGGAFSVRVRVAKGAAPGRYLVTARCGGGNLGVSATLRVR